MRLRPYRFPAQKKNGSVIIEIGIGASSASSSGTLPTLAKPPAATIDAMLPRSALSSTGLRPSSSGVSGSPT